MRVFPSAKASALSTIDMTAASGAVEAATTIVKGYLLQIAQAIKMIDYTDTVRG